MIETFGTVEEFIDYVVGTEVVPVPARTVSVIIPFFNNWHLTHTRLMELYSHIPFPIEIILVNDCSTDDGIDGAMEWWTNNSKHTVRWIRNLGNLGFGGSMNNGVIESSGNVVVLLSNDVQIKGDFISVLLSEISTNPLNLYGGRYINFDTGWNNLVINGEKILFPYLEGWLLACTRTVWDEIGGFDPIYAPMDMEDIDLSTEAIHAFYGLEELPCKHLYQHQHGSTIYKVYGVEERMRRTKINQQKFIGKWSKILK